MAAAPFDFGQLVLLLGSVCMSQAFCKLAASCKDDVPGTVSCCMLSKGLCGHSRGHPKAHAQLTVSMFPNRLKKPAATQKLAQNQRVKCCSTCLMAMSVKRRVAAVSLIALKAGTEPAPDQKSAPKEPRQRLAGFCYVPACGPGEAGPQPFPPTVTGTCGGCSACRNHRAAAARWAGGSHSPQGQGREPPLYQYPWQTLYRMLRCALPALPGQPTLCKWVCHCLRARTLGEAPPPPSVRVLGRTLPSLAHYRASECCMLLGARSSAARFPPRCVVQDLRVHAARRELHIAHHRPADEAVAHRHLRDPTRPSA